MLTSLEVRDLAVIASAQLALGPGFTVLTGETGAGKSLLVDALGLVLGDRGNAALVRSGCDHAGVTAEFTLPDDGPARALLAGRGLPVEDNLLLLHRQMGADGRSRAWINGVSVPLAALREIGEALVEIHGQHEHLALARPGHQRDLLDAFAETVGEAAEVMAASTSVRAAAEALSEARQAAHGRDARVEFLRFQLGELEALSPRAGEYAQLLAEYERLRHGERFAESVQTALVALDEGEIPALAAVAAARQALTRLPQAGGLSEARGLLGDAESLLNEAVSHLRRFADAEADPEHLDRLNARIARYQTLARKHDRDPDELASRHSAFAEEIAELEASEDRIARLEHEHGERVRNYRKIAGKLSGRRRKAAPDFAKAVTRGLRELGMPQSQLEVALEPEDEAACPPGGRERVLFEVSMNRGQAPGPVSQVASGGELSRLALAVEVLAGGAGGVPAMVFDEVDAGVSGRVAELVGRRLKALADSRQVLCVTHLPQVAALADHHYAVSKREDRGTTTTEVEILEPARRIDAIAQMLGGIRVTESARNHARELLERAVGG